LARIRTPEIPLGNAVNMYLTILRGGYQDKNDLQQVIEK